MSKFAVVSTAVPAPIGPYSAAIATIGVRTIYVSGQIAINPATQVFEDGDVASQTHMVMRNLGAVLRAGGATYSDLVKVTVYLRDMADFPAVNAVYGTYLSQPFPARATVQAAGLPRGAAVEIDGIAVLDA